MIGLTRAGPGRARRRGDFVAVWVLPHTGAGLDPLYKGCKNRLRSAAWFEA
jgi:hypothetical protein